MNDWPRNKGTDHWWPRALQKHWCDPNGQIFVTSAKGTEPRSRSNKKIGSNRGWHHVDFGDSPWTHSFEGDFGTVDNKIHGIVNWIYDNVPPPLDHGQGIPDWVTRHLPASSGLDVLPAEVASDLLDLLLSLLIRSPAFKNYRMKQPLTWGLPEDRRLGTAEISRYYNHARSIIRRQRVKGFYLFIYTASGNFIYGDGMLDNLTSSIIGMNLRGYCLVPLTPTLCLFFTTSLHGIYAKQVASFVADNQTLQAINEITSVYSKEVLFSNKEDIGSHVNFLGEHQRLHAHSNLLIESFLSGSHFRREQ